MLESIEDYCKNLFKVSNNDLKIIINKIPKLTKIVFNNQEILLSGGGDSTCEVKNAVQLKLVKDVMKKYKYTLNYVINNT